MGAKKTVEYPPWVEEWRGPGRTIRKKGDGYALYRCTTITVPGEPRKISQTYLGMITEKDGFVPKRGTSDLDPYLEYGLSHLIWVNLRGKILQHLPPGKNSPVLKLGILQFIFGSTDEAFIQNSYLTYGDADSLIPLSRKISAFQVDRVAKMTEQELRGAIPDERDYSVVVGLLRLCVVRRGHPVKAQPALPGCVKEILGKYNLKM